MTFQSPSSNRTKTWQAINSGIVFLIAVMALLGWLFNSTVLKSIVPGLSPMKPNTAISLLLIGAALWSLRDEPATPTRRRLAQVCALIVCLIALFTIAEYWFGWNPGIDQLLFRDDTPNIAVLFPQRMSLATACALLLLSLSLLIISANQRPLIAQVSALIVVGIALFVLAGYLYGVTSLYAVFAFGTIALPTAIALFLAGISVLLTRPRRGFVVILSAGTLGSVIGRWLLPAAFLVPLLIGWLSLKGQQLGLYDSELGLALFAVSNVIIFTLLIGWCALLLNNLDSAGQRSAARIHRLNRTLAVLSDVNQAIVRIRQIPDLLDTICQIVVKSGGFSTVWIGWVDPATQDLTLAAHAGTADHYEVYLQTILSSREQIGAFLASLADGRSYQVFNQLQADPRIPRERQQMAQQLGFGSAILLPISVGQERRGFMGIYASERNFFDDEELRLMSELAGDITFALEFSEQDARRQAVEANLKRSVQRLEILHEIDRQIVQGEPITRLVETTLKRLRQIIPCQRANLALIDRSTGDAELFAVDIDGETMLNTGTRFPREADFALGFDANHTLVIDDIRPLQEVNSRAKQFASEGMISVLSVLLMDQNTPIGSLSFLSTTPAFFISDYQEIAREVASQLAIAIRQMHLNQEIIHHTSEIEHNLHAIENMRQFLQTTLDAFPSGVAVLDTEGTIINVNAAWERFSAENGGLSATAYLHSNYLTVCDNAVGEMSEEAAPAAAGIRAVISGEKRDFYLEYPCNAPGQEHWFGMRVTPFAEPAPHPVVVAHVDISERKAAELALQEVNETLEQRVMERTLELSRTKERAEAILNTSTNGILVVDSELCIRQTNPAFDHLFALAAENSFSRSLLDFIHRDDASQMRDTVQGVLADHSGKRLELRCIRATGATFEAEFSIAHFADEPEHGEVVCVIQDITDRKEREQQLIFNASLQQAVTDAVIATNLDFQIQSWNPAAARIYGWTAEEVIGKPLGNVLGTQFVSGATRDRVLREFLEQGYWTDEVVQYHKDRHPIDILSSSVLFKDNNGKPLGVVAVNHDITERKRASEALAASEERFRTLVRGVRDYAIFTLDPNGNVTSWNSGAERIKGYSAEEILGQNFSRFYPQESIARGEPERVLEVARNEGQFFGEGWRVRKDGSQFWAEVSVTAVRDSQDHLIGFSKVTRDLTERKRDENALLEQRDFLQLVVDNVPGLIMVKDQKGRFQLVNHLVADLYHASPALMLGKTNTDLSLSEQVLSFSAEQDREALSSGQPLFIAEEQVQDRYYQTSKIPLKRPDGSYDRLLIVATDITAHKQAEEALRRAFEQEKELGELKSRFVSVASHEFRTPLATILAAAETLSAYRQKMTDSQIDHRINNIRDQVDHLKNIIEDVLQLARIQAGRVEFNPVVLDLDSLCRSVIDEFQSHPDNAHRITYYCDENLHKVRLDKKLIRQIITNLVSNAIKYSPTASQIDIRLEYADQTIILKVHDQGIGIPEADLAHLFEPFHRASNVGSISGTGLGLSITKEAVELHGGIIGVDSQVGIGTTFVVTIPIADRTEEYHDQNSNH